MITRTMDMKGDVWERVGIGYVYKRAMGRALGPNKGRWKAIHLG